MEFNELNSRRVFGLLNTPRNKISTPRIACVSAIHGLIFVHSLAAIIALFAHADFSLRDFEQLRNKDVRLFGRQSYTVVFVAGVVTVVPAGSVP